MMRRLPIVATGLAVADTALAAPGVELADLSAVIVSLALVIGFIFAAAWVVRRSPLGIGRSNGPLKVLAALPLGSKERLLLVEARGTELLIAVSPAGVFNVGVTATQLPARPSASSPVFSLPEQP